MALVANRGQLLGEKTAKLNIGGMDYCSMVAALGDYQLLIPERIFAMHASSYAFLVAAGFAAISQGARVLGEVAAGSGSVFTAVQYGGTGGLILALLFAVRALWNDRMQERRHYMADRVELQNLVTTERNAHRDELSAMRETHKADLEEQTNRFVAELQRQIERERHISDGRYEHNGK